MSIADRKQCSLKYLLQNYTSKELTQWTIYYSKEPSAAIREQFLLTQLLSIFHHVNVKDSKVKPQDFNFPNLWVTKQQMKDSEFIKELSNVKGVSVQGID